MQKLSKAQKAQKQIDLEKLISVKIWVNPNIGIKLDPTNCPIARAIKAVLNDFYCIAVGHEVFSIRPLAKTPSEYFTYCSGSIPKNVREWILAFDTKKKAPKGFLMTLSGKAKYFKEEYR